MLWMFICLALVILFGGVAFVLTIVALKIAFYVLLALLVVSLVARALRSV
jgi:hypothetical protein